MPSKPAPVLVYAQDIQSLSGSYAQVLFGLGELTQQLCTNPLVIRSPEYSQSARMIIGAIFALRQELDDLRSPAAVEGIHEEFEAGAKLFVRAAMEIETFLQRHDFDDFVEATQLVTRAVNRWQAASDALSRLIESEASLSGAQVASGTAPDPSLVRYAEGIRQISDDYTGMLLELGALTQQLCTNPEVVDSAEFVAASESVVHAIRDIRGRLDALTSPDAAEDLHEEFEFAGDLFVLASLKIDSFTRGHQFDDVAEATELVGAALGLWQETSAKLALLLQGASE